MSLQKKLIDLDSIVGIICLALLLGTIILQVSLRFFFSRPLMGAEEFTRYMVICVVMIPLAYTERTGNNIIMEEIQAMFPTILRKTVNFASQFLSMIVYGIVAISSINVIINNIGNQTATLGIPFWLFFAPTVYGLSVITIVKLMVLLNAYHKRGLPWE
jgi:TRAP-type C4-dicarboxylate transport system permease small subunit